MRIWPNSYVVSDIFGDKCLKMIKLKENIGCKSGGNENAIEGIMSDQQQTSRAILLLPGIIT